ncbi:hypothetical protein PAXINDRAFT_157886 [Paxillus involutus ATCC 200175]|uniref:Uncharacterized protein n=1 Tax=Paxillus involutus ATCC 200175 TaxID=664439 RepID=A0A0C9TNP8_PAXIN|nr:hypothetical protein PAXINDRAFT_157886 [Paxillus involutus ATCC 200175]
MSSGLSGMVKSKYLQYYTPTRLMKHTLTANAQSSWRICTQYKKTNAETEGLKLKQKEHCEAYTEALAAANQVVLYQAKHMHECCQSMKGTRQPSSQWNTFIKKETEHINNGMSKEEQIVATEENTGLIKETHKMKAFTPQNVMINAFHDTEKTLKSIDKALMKFHSCTGLEFLFLSVKKDMGVQGDAVAPTRVNHMYYVNFNNNITAKYRVVIENWPLPKFCAPRDVSSRNELHVLFHSWQSNTTRFCKLTSKEFEKWKTNHFNRDCEAPASNVQPNGDASTDPPSPSGPDTSGKNAQASRRSHHADTFSVCPPACNIRLAQAKG